MSGPIIVFTRVRVRVPRELWPDPDRASSSARYFAHAHGMATPVIVDVLEREADRLYTMAEAGDAAIAADAKRSRT